MREYFVILIKIKQFSFGYISYVDNILFKLVRTIMELIMLVYIFHLSSGISFIYNYTNNFIYLFFLYTLYLFYILYNNQILKKK